MLKPLLAGFGVTGLALCGVIAGELGAFGTAGDASPVAAMRPAATRSATATSAVRPDRTGDDVAEILARPLFSPNRRPPPPEAVAATAAAAEAPLPRLAGVLVDGRERRVIFAAADGKPLVLGEGAKVGGFVVHAIEAGSVTLVGPDGTRVLRPQYNKNTSAGITHAAAPVGLPGLPGFVAQPQPGAPLPGFGPVLVPVPQVVAPVASANGADPSR